MEQFINQFPALIIAVPLLTALFTPVLAFSAAKLCHAIAQLALLATTAMTGTLLYQVITNGNISYHLGKWEPPYGIEFVLDPLAAVVAVVVAFVACVCWMGSKPVITSGQHPRRRAAVFQTLYLLVTVGLIGVVIAGDIFTTYVFIEVASIAGYGILALGGPKAAMAIYRYIFLGTIGATFYLLGVGFLYANTGSLNMADITVLIKPMLDSPAVLFAVAMVVLGFGIKSALFPLHMWLPDTYTGGPTAAVSFISGTMTKVFGYAMFRFLFYIFGGPGTAAVRTALDLMGWMAAAGIIYGSVMAIAQKDLRRMLAYSSVAQLNYLHLGMALAVPAAYIGFVFQIISHAITKSCLFMIAGGIKYKTGNTEIDNFNGLYKRMPIISVAFTIAALSMIGIPITSGFFAKWYLLEASATASQYIFVGVLVLSGLLNAVYFFRVFERIYFRPADKDIIVRNTGKLELPINMLTPVIIMSVTILAVGCGAGWIVENILQYIVVGGGI